MLLTSLSIALLACLFGYKQSRELKRSQDLISSLEYSNELEVDSHNKTLARALKDKEALLKEIQELKLDLELSEELQIDENKFQDLIQDHVLNVLSSIDLEQAYELACDNNDLEINIEDLTK